MAYPTEINNLIDVTGTETLAEAGHAQRHNDANTALESVRDFVNGGAAGTILVSAGSASAPSWTRTITSPSASIVPLTVQGASGQTASLFEVRSSAAEQMALSATSATVLTVGSGAGSNPVEISVGGGRNASGFAYIDFVGDTTHTDYGLRILRGNAGANTDSNIIHRGTGLFGLVALDAAPMIFLTNNTERMRIDSAGKISIGTTGAANRSLFIKQSTSSTEIMTMEDTGASYTGQSFQVIISRAANAAYNFINLYSGGAADNEFTLRGDGNGLCDGAWTGGGADYAEYFEWSDGNPNNEDRRGIAVTLEGEKIKPAEVGDVIIGVISGNPSVVGDAAWNKWSEKYLRDDFGTYILEDYDVLQWADEKGEDRAVDADGPDAGDAPADATVVVQQRRTLNPAYDPEQAYVSREDRPEWDCVGLMGKLRVRKGQPTDARWIKMRDISGAVEEWLVR